MFLSRRYRIHVRINRNKTMYLSRLYEVALTSRSGISHFRAAFQSMPDGQWANKLTWVFNRHLYSYKMKTKSNFNVKVQVELLHKTSLHSCSAWSEDRRSGLLLGVCFHVSNKSVFSAASVRTLITCEQLNRVVYLYVFVQVAFSWERFVARLTGKRSLSTMFYLVNNQLCIGYTPPSTHITRVGTVVCVCLHVTNKTAILYCSKIALVAFMGAHRGMFSSDMTSEATITREPLITRLTDERLLPRVGS